MNLFPEVAARIVKEQRENNASIEPNETDEEILQYVFDTVDPDNLIAEYGEDAAEWPQSVKDVFFLTTLPQHFGVKYDK